VSQSDVQLHPVLAAMSAVDTTLASVAEVDPMYMSVEEKGAALLGLSSILDRVEEVRLRVLASADDVAAQEGARDAAAWLAHHGRRDPGECRRQLRLARALVERAPTAGALRDGGVNLAQAEVVVRALDALPEEIDTAVRTAAEGRLLEEAARLEARLLEQEEAWTARRTSITTRRNGDGTTDLRIRVPDLICDRFLTYLNAFTAPRRSGTGPTDDRRPHERRLGEAFGSFLEAIDPTPLPLHGGDATTLLVTVDLGVLRGGPGTALVGDTSISAGQARRLACTASIIPVVLDGASQVLDLGRRRRLFSRTQRKALSIRQPTCGADICDIPAAWCEAHHAGDPWSHGGRTDLVDGVLLCSFHHHRAHDHRYRTDRLPDGGVRFHRRT
jgi:hypothetical protein